MYFSILLDLINGALLIAIAFLIKSSEMANTLSLFSIFSIILPGFFLTGFSRRLIVGQPIDYKIFRKILIVSIVLNFLFLFIFFILAKHIKMYFPYLIGCAFFFSFSSACQTLSSVWFYLYKSKKDFVRLKLISTLIRISAVSAAFLTKEIAFLIILAACVPIYETFKSFNLLKYMKADYNNESIKNNDNFYYGFSIMFSRGVSAIVKFYIEKFYSSTLAILLIFEQVFSGILALYERYLIQLKHNHEEIKRIKYLLILIIGLSYAAVIFVNQSLIYSKLALATYAFFSLLPSSSIFNLIKQNKINIVAKYSLFVSIASLFFAIFNYYILKINFIYFVIYTISPIVQFIIYSRLEKLSKE